MSTIDLFNLATFADQSFLALLALIGVFTVFRLQHLDGQIGTSLVALKNFVKTRMLTSAAHLQWTNADVDCWLDKDIIVHLRSFIANELLLTDRLKKIIFFDALCDYYLVIYDLEKFRIKMIDWVKNISFRLLFWIMLPKAILLFNFPDFCKANVIVLVFSALFVEIYFCLKFVNFTLVGLELRRINNAETNNAFPGLDYGKKTINEITNKRFEAKRNGQTWPL